MSGAIPPPHYAFMAWCLVKHRINFKSEEHFLTKELIFLSFSVGK
jgi:hypothetical protein